jgi:hypothetical protein
VGHPNIVVAASAFGLENEADMADAIKPEYVRCVFYVYPTLSDARSGARSGGTGVFVGVKSRIQPSG